MFLKISFVLAFFAIKFFLSNNSHKCEKCGKSYIIQIIIIIIFAIELVIAKSKNFCRGNNVIVAVVSFRYFLDDNKTLTVLFSLMHCFPQFNLELKSLFYGRESFKGWEKSTKFIMKCVNSLKKEYQRKF